VLCELCGLAHMMIVMVHFAARCKSQDISSVCQQTIALAMCGFAIVSCQAAVIVDNSVVSGKASGVGMVPLLLSCIMVVVVL